MRRTVRLRVLLTATFMVVVALPLLVAGLYAVSSYSTDLRNEAQRAVDTNMKVAQASLQDISSRREQQMRGLALDSAYSPDNATREELASQVKILGMTAMAVIDANGEVVASSAGSPYPAKWPRLRDAGRVAKAASFFDIVPQDELSALGLAKELKVAVKATPNGTVKSGEESGALSIITVSPIPKGRGAVVAIDSLKMRMDFVDSVVAKGGGTCTVFQHGVRVATTVKNDAGARAIGTVISDPVRAKTLNGGEPFRGQAFVVNQPYMTVYDALRNPSGAVVGIVYVGLPLKPYNASISRFAATFGAIALGALLLALAAAFVSSRGMTKPLEGILEAATRVARGDLTAGVPATGYREAQSLADSFEAMTKGLRTILGQVGGSAGHLREVSKDISQASDGAADMANRQASSVAETTATVEQLSRTFISVAEGARRVLGIAEQSLERAESGRDTIDASDATMTELAQGAQEVREAAEAAAGVARDISEMTLIISGISEQTKILALNAAIEAARAGDAGRGFGVVATEIRSLADSVGRSAGRIKDLVSGVQDTSDTLLRTAQRQLELAARGVGDSKDSRDAFDSIVEQMSQTTAAAREIASASAEQRSAAEQIARAMQDVSASSTNSAAAARQLSASARAVELEAEQLHRGMEGFKTA
jgi:methyl-accepting chemotaxis protein